MDMQQLGSLLQKLPAVLTALMAADNQLRLAQVKENILKGSEAIVDAGVAIEEAISGAGVVLNNVTSETARLVTALFSDVLREAGILEGNSRALLTPEEEEMLTALKVALHVA